MEANEATSTYQPVIPIARVAHLMRELMVMLSENPEGISPVSKAINMLTERVTLTDYEATQKPGKPLNFKTILSYSSTELRYAGWMIKDNFTTWLITEDGKQALKTYPDEMEFWKEARSLARAWRKVQGTTTISAPIGTSDEISEKVEETAAVAAVVAAVEEEDTAADFYRETKETAPEFISKYLDTMPGHVFQELIQHLLAAMGYYILWGTYKGPDGGIDIVASRDPLGVQIPRVKVQAKRQKTKVSRDTVKSFYANLKADDVGIFVCTEGFSSEAQIWINDQDKHTTLIDQDKLIRLWLTHQDKLSETARSLLPLEPVYLLNPKSSDD